MSHQFSALKNNQWVADAAQVDRMKETDEEDVENITVEVENKKNGQEFVLVRETKNFVARVKAQEREQTTKG